MVLYNTQEISLIQNNRITEDAVISVHFDNQILAGHHRPVCYLTAMMSTSTIAPFGKAAT